MTSSDLGHLSWAAGGAGRVVTGERFLSAWFTLSMPLHLAQLSICLSVEFLPFALCPLPSALCLPACLPGMCS